MPRRETLDESSRTATDEGGQAADAEDRRSDQGTDALLAGSEPEGEAEPRLGGPPTAPFEPAGHATLGSALAGTATDTGMEAGGDGSGLATGSGAITHGVTEGDE
jgi:hypothetical protein